MTATIWESAQRRFNDQRRDGRWATPGNMAVELEPTTRQTPALDAIDEALVDVANGKCMRLMILMPPQEGKSQRVSRWLPLWKLHDWPNTRIAIVSFNNAKAREWGKQIRDDVNAHPSLKLRLRADSKAAGRWKLAGWRGGVYCTGVAGDLTGQPVDLLIIDDPIADLDHALSPVYRERARRFWQAVAVPRLSPTTPVVLIQTRWHEDDLAGWLITDNPEPWRVLSIPAIAESTDDALGRVPGEGMRSTRGQRDWAATKREVGEYVWASLYQQRPAPAEGGLFKRASLRHWTSTPEDLGTGRRVGLDGRQVLLADSWKFLTVDLAASIKTSADYTVAAVWTISPDGDLVLIDGFRKRIAEADHFPQIRALRERHNADVVYVESRMFGTTLVYEAGQSGIPVVELKADVDKRIRALPASARADNGRLWLPPADLYPWVPEWIDELAAFPNGAHDDVVDVVAYAARVAAAHWVPQEPAVLADARRALRQSSPDLDLMSVPY